MSLEDRVRAELLVIRKSAAGLTVAALAHSPVTCGLLGNGDPRVAYNKLEHEVLAADGDTSLGAAASSLGLSSDKPTHLGRLDDFGAEHGYDQRQVRRYSDKGIRQIARLVSSNWAVESVPCLDVVGYQTGPDRFAFATQTRRQHFIEMKPLRIVLRQGADEPRELHLPSTETEEGISTVTRLDAPIEVATHAEEISLSWVWQGELWPKFLMEYRTEVAGHRLSGETLGNKMMVRVLAA